jgi:tetratricopeptide (TPR) repeat protein
MTEITVNPKAILVLERGIKALQKKNYKQATNAFNSLIEKFSGERALRDRALTYLKTCERMSAAAPKAPTDGSDILHLATYHLNRGELEEARLLLDKAKRKTSVKSEATYGFALYHALLGEEEAALDCLAEAIELDETCKYTARTENDFASLQETPRFQELVG